jgi:apolipoprotein N-acyltransferase
MKAVLLAVLTGVLFALSLPPFGQAWLAWFAIAPLLIAAQGLRPLERIGLGLIAGLVSGFVHVDLRGDTTARLYGYLPYMYIAGIFCVQAVVGVALRSRWQGLPWVLFVACLGVVLEWLTAFTPLPVTIALSQYKTLGLTQIAAVTGMWGISFLLWLANAALAETLLTRRLRPAVLGLPLLFVLAAILYGHVTLSSWPKGNTLRVASIQDHDPQETTLFVPAPADDNSPSQEQLTQQAAAQGAKLAVWSEGSLGSSFVPGARINPTEKLAKKFGIYLIVGFTGPGKPKPYNCAAIVDPSGKTRAIYHKIHLFGGEAQEFQSGDSVRAFDTGLGGVGMEICFDSCFADITRHLALSGAQIVAVPNFDPLTEHGDLHRLHSALMTLRAVENHVAIIRSDPNGHSVIVAPDGQIMADAPMWTADALVADVQIGDGKGTFYSRWGDWLAYLCIAFVIASAVALKRGRRTHQPASIAGATNEPARPTPASVG